MSKKIVFTGGGSAGHVTPNIAIIEAMQAQNWLIDYIGSQDGIEKKMIGALSIPYHVVRSGKLRRYFSWRTLLEPINILIGIIQSFVILKKIKPDIVFSKGGFVAFPVVVGAWLNRISIIAHESDMTPGLANRISYPFVQKICVPSEATKCNFKHQDKLVVTGTPIRRALFEGSKDAGLIFCGFNDKKPCLLLIGGSLGAKNLNRVLRDSLSELTKTFQVIHLCGKGNIDPTYEQQTGYRQFEYITKELPDLFAAASVIISRSGANSLYEILALSKPHVLIPLSRKASRGDQIDNANHFRKQGVSIVIADQELSKPLLLKAVNQAISGEEEIIKRIKALNIQSASGNVLSLIDSYFVIPPTK